MSMIFNAVADGARAIGRGASWAWRQIPGHQIFSTAIIGGGLLMADRALGHEASDASIGLLPENMQSFARNARDATSRGVDYVTEHAPGLLEDTMGFLGLADGAAAPEPAAG